MTTKTVQTQATVKKSEKSLIPKEDLLIQRFIAPKLQMSFGPAVDGSAELSCFVPTDELSCFVHVAEWSCFVPTAEWSCFVPAAELSCSFLLLS
ncbi:hypothetical protein TNCV_2041851 [Trichonephila clavipes]|nr:hypothetical protein TNCV_2041851 [Trichonephila clavipes]